MQRCSLQKFWRARPSRLRGCLCPAIQWDQMPFKNALDSHNRVRTCVSNTILSLSLWCDFAGLQSKPKFLRMGEADPEGLSHNARTQSHSWHSAPAAWDMSWKCKLRSLRSGRVSASHQRARRASAILRPLRGHLVANCALLAWFSSARLHPCEASQHRKQLHCSWFSFDLLRLVCNSQLFRPASLKLKSTTHTHTHIYIYLSIYLSISLYTYMSTVRSTYILMVASMSMNIWLDASCRLPHRWPLLPSCFQKGARHCCCIPRKGSVAPLQFATVQASQSRTQDYNLYTKIIMSIYIYICVCVCVCRHTSLPRVAVDIYLCVYVHLAGCVLQAAAVLGSCALTLAASCSQPAKAAATSKTSTSLPSSSSSGGSAHCDLEVAVEVRQCPLQPGSRGWGPAVPTGILSSRWRSGSAHWDLALAVEVRLCPLGSGLRGGGGGGDGGGGCGGGGGEQLW